MNVKVTFKKVFASIDIFTTDIITAFQEVAKRNLDKLEDAGCGMYNLEMPIFEGMDECIVQVYPNDEYHNVWILIYDEEGDNEYMEIDDFPTCVQTQILKNYMKKLHVSHILNIF